MRVKVSRLAGLIKGVPRLAGEEGGSVGVEDELSDLSGFSRNSEITAVKGNPNSTHIPDYHPDALGSLKDAIASRWQNSLEKGHQSAIGAFADGLDPAGTGSDHGQLNGGSGWRGGGGRR